MISSEDGQVTITAFCGYEKLISIGRDEDGVVYIEITEEIKSQNKLTGELITVNLTSNRYAPLIVPLLDFELNNYKENYIAEQMYEEANVLQKVLDFREI